MDYSAALPQAPEERIREAKRFLDLAKLCLNGVADNEKTAEAAVTCGVYLEAARNAADHCSRALDGNPVDPHPLHRAGMMVYSTLLFEEPGKGLVLGSAMGLIVGSMVDEMEGVTPKGLAAEGIPLTREYLAKVEAYLMGGSDDGSPSESD